MHHRYFHSHRVMARYDIDQHMHAGKQGKAPVLSYAAMPWDVIDLAQSHSSYQNPLSSPGGNYPNHMHHILDLPIKETACPNTTWFPISRPTDSSNSSRGGAGQVKSWKQMVFPQHHLISFLGNQLKESRMLWISCRMLDLRFWPEFRNQNFRINVVFEVLDDIECFVMFFGVLGLIWCNILGI